MGLGKTVEAGLVLREMPLRRRVDYTVVLAPAAMTGQWRDELQSKFGLAFDIIDARHLEALRRRRGYGANPWGSGSRFILSHRLLGDEAYVAPLRDVLEDFRARSLLILDEAHHAAPSGGGRYAIESQFTRSLRDLSDRFEHRLFLSATPHNGHPNSFATLLELLDPQRFTRGVALRPADLEPVMVRRLKATCAHSANASPNAWSNRSSSTICRKPPPNSRSPRCSPTIAPCARRGSPPCPRPPRAGTPRLRRPATAPPLLDPRLRPHAEGPY